jgi:hypothetical protein
MTNETPTDFYETWWDGPAVTDYGHDRRRLRFEVQWAVEHSHDPTLIEMVDGPVQLAVAPEGGILFVLDGYGARRGEVPLYRLLEVDWALVEAYLEDCVNQGGPRAAEALSVLRDHPDRVHAPPDLDFVILNFRDGQRMVFHRREGIPEWPKECRRYLAHQHNL